MFANNMKGVNPQPAEFISLSFKYSTVPDILEKIISKSVVGFRQKGIALVFLFIFDDMLIIVFG